MTVPRSRPRIAALRGLPGDVPEGLPKIAAAELLHEEPARAAAIDDLRALVGAAPLRDEVDVARRGAILDRLVAELELHYAREEDALFSFALARFPNLARSVARLAWLHDAVIGCLVRLRAALLGGDTRAASRLERFVRAHAEHDALERSFVDAVLRRLDPLERGAFAHLVASSRAG